MRQRIHSSERNADHGEDSSPVGKANADDTAISAISSTQRAESRRSLANLHEHPVTTAALPPADQQASNEPAAEYHSCCTGVHLWLTLERPPAAIVANCDRGERFRLLTAHARAQREQIQAWAAREDLCSEIMRISEANTFHLLFVHCTPAAAKRLVEAPGVVNVTVAPTAHRVSVD